MSYIKLATRKDFEHTRIRSFAVMGKKIGIIKRDDGSFYAMDVGCKHQNADITKGTIEGNVATCPRHQWQYDLETGECLNHDSLPLKRFPLKIEGEDIKVAVLPVNNIFD
ncbi:MAG: Rieske 2Fe-2S domain-containing protein [Chitinivibrionales bacterium]|nr:Rieske 2Fe-2S domain-containing protein [Chitinivibrionales bacterium]